MQTPAFPSGEEIKARVLAKAEEQARSTGEALLELGEFSAAHLSALTHTMSRAVGGDKRAMAHLEAQLAHLDFQAKATAYLELVAWRNAILEVAAEIADTLVDGALAFASGGLSALLKKSFEGLA